MSLLKRLRKNSHQVAAFISVKPRYADKLVEGLKKYEFRKSMLKQDLSHIIIYSSSPIKKIIGVAEVESVNVASPTAIWESTKHVAGISRKAFREYFRGRKQAVAIKIKNVIRLKEGIEPNKVREGFRVPQSFLYADKEFLKGVLCKEMERKDG